MPLRIDSAAEQSERKLVSLVASGDQSASAELFDAFGESVLRFVYRRVGEQMEDAEEVTLDTFESAVRLSGAYDARSSVFTWLCGIAKLRIIDFYRKAGRDKRTAWQSRISLETVGELGGLTLDHVLDKIESERIVDELLFDLTDDEREALLLRYVEQFSVREIARHMNRSEKGVEGLLTRAKNKPRAHIGRWLEGGAQ